MATGMGLRLGRMRLVVQKTLLDVSEFASAKNSDDQE
jgi:hypothetical protein